jgi:myo-inositol 2-dehydrogenase/D-chiro-inositol 1-dehydrogenase
MPSVQLVAVIEPLEKRRLEMAAQARCVSFATLQEALEDQSLKPDGVMICTPTATHFELVKLTLNAGLPVFCEKPVAQETHEVDEVYALAESKGLPLLCGFQRRFDPSFMKLKQAIVDGQIGQVQIVRTTSRDHPLPSFEFLKTSGGIFHDCCSHDIDVHRWLIGEDPIEVYASGHAWFPEIASFNDYDAVVLMLKFPSGITTTIDLHRNARYGYDQRIEVMGSKGMVEAHNKPKTSMVLSTDAGVVSDSISYSFTDRYPDAYKAEIVHFIEVVRSKGRVPLRVTHQDVRKCGIIADACDKSAHEGIPIKISYD